MPFAQLIAVLPLRDVAYSLRVPSNSNDLKCNKDENETVIAHRSDCGLFLSQNRKEQFTMSEPDLCQFPLFYISSCSKTTSLNSSNRMERKDLH